MSTSRRLNFFLASLLVAAAVGCSSNDTPYSAPEPQPDASDASEDVAEPNDASTNEDAQGDEPVVVDAGDEPDAQDDGEAPVEASADAGTDAEEVPDALADGAGEDAAGEAASGDAEADVASDAAPQDSGADAAGDVSVDASTDAPSDVSADTPIDVSADAQQGDAAIDGEVEGGDDGAACSILGGLGQVTCVCNELDDAEWGADAPFIFHNKVDFGLTGWDLSQLTAGGKQIWDDGNLGGSSIESEITAYEMLARCDQASLILSESKIDYIDEGGKKTDILMSIDGRNIGVSVVRAYHYPPGDPYTEAEATAILTKKLSDIPYSQKNAKPYNSWERSMLAVIAYDQQHADTIASAWNKLDASLRWNVIVVVTVTDGDDSVIY